MTKQEMFLQAAKTLNFADTKTLASSVKPLPTTTKQEKSDERK